MKNIFFYCLLILFPFTIGISQENSSLLWEISGKKVKSPSYIFGTIHLIPKDKFYFPNALTEKLIETECLVMEIGGIKEQAGALKYLLLEEGNVFDYFSKEQADSLFDYFEKNLEMSEEQVRLGFGRMKPFVLLQLLTKDQFGEDAQSYEISLEQVAKKNSIEIQGLETVEEQIGFINDISMEEQVNMVMEALRSDEDMGIDELIEAYLSQDLSKIHDYIMDTGMRSSEIEEKLLINRNNNWIKPIQKIIRKKRAFIAVGAAHLAGEDGIIELLKQKGYTLTPLKF